MNRHHQYILLTQGENSLNEEFTENEEKRKRKLFLNWVSILLLLLLTK
jgi:hypothetical protein